MKRYICKVTYEIDAENTIDMTNRFLEIAGEEVFDRARCVEFVKDESVYLSPSKNSDEIAFSTEAIEPRVKDTINKWL